jgi:hypothetical protein
VNFLYDNCQMHSGVHYFDAPNESQVRVEARRP